MFSSAYDLAAANDLIAPELPDGVRALVHEVLGIYLRANQLPARVVIQETIKPKDNRDDPWATPETV